jgi:hypothetical protein
VVADGFEQADLPVADRSPGPEIETQRKPRHRRILIVAAGARSQFRDKRRLDIFHFGGSRVEKKSNPSGPRRVLQECSGACGDLGTFIPHVIGAMTVAGLAPAGVLFGFAVFLIGTGLFYGLPIPVQPMKAVSAVILTDGLRPGEVAAAGMILGIVLLVLGATGAIGRFARLIPQSVSTGLQLGLGLLLGVLGIKLMFETPLIGFGALALLFVLLQVPYCPAAPITLGAAAIARWFSNSSGAPHEIAFAWSAPQLVVPTWPEVWHSLEIAVLRSCP